MKCFYHSADLDGKCAGFWVKEFAKRSDDYGFELIGINYGQEFPFDKINKGEMVYIVDYSISPDEMRQLLNITEFVIWIDHHKTAIEKYKDFEYDIRGIRHDGIAGCMLTYGYLRYVLDTGWNVNANLFMIEKYIKSAPMFTKLIADYDVWTFEYGDDTKAFQLGLQSEENSPESDIWLNMEYGNLILKGRAMIQYRDSFAESYCKHKGFETEFEGYKCFAINLAMCGTEHFKSVDNGTYDVFIGFSYNGEDWNVSLRSAKENVDVSEIAKKYGGGGHRSASGFNTKELLFKRVDKEDKENMNGI